MAVALELNDEGKSKRVAMAPVKRVTGHHLKRFAVKAIARGSKLRTDGYSVGCQHQINILPSTARVVPPKRRSLRSNFGRW